MPVSYAELPAEVKARRYVDYLIESDLIVYEVPEDYEEAIAKLSVQFGGYDAVRR